MAAVLAASWLTLFPTETRALGQSVTAASLFFSNVHFSRSAGYFDPALEDALLLHTWTLSVEEQFYLLLPVFLIFVARRLGSRYAIGASRGTRWRPSSSCRRGPGSSAWVRSPR
jgi:peptidoglycan/LPS O-acetylase OafA/YrhL